jgi:hypothetical protein
MCRRSGTWQGAAHDEPIRTVGGDTSVSGRGQYSMVRMALRIAGSAVFVVAFVTSITGPGWLSAAAWVLLYANLVYIVFTRSGSQTILEMQETGVLPRRLSLRAIHMTVAVLLAVVLAYVIRGAT